MKLYSKLVAQVVATILVAILPVLTADEYTAERLIPVALAGLAAVGVVIVPNLPTGVAAYSKSIIAALSAAGTLAVTLLSDGALDPTDWVQIAIAALGAVGVFAVSNGPQASGGTIASVRVGVDSESIAEAVKKAP